jgi:hypothetical protein
MLPWRAIALQKDIQGLAPGAIGKEQLMAEADAFDDRARQLPLVGEVEGALGRRCASQQEHRQKRCAVAPEGFYRARQTFALKSLGEEW